MYLRVRFVVFIFALKVHYSKLINPVFSTIYKFFFAELFADDFEDFFLLFLRYSGSL